MKRFLEFILVLLFAISCASQRMYLGYNNVSVLDDGNGGTAYYHNVHVTSYEKTDSLNIVQFTDEKNNLYIICGKTILVETVLVEKYNNYYKYYGSRPYMIYNSPYRRIKPKYYPPKPHRKSYRNNPNYKQSPRPNNRPGKPSKQNKPMKNNRGGNSSHRQGGRR